MVGIGRYVCADCGAVYSTGPYTIEPGARCANCDQGLLERPSDGTCPVCGLPIERLPDREKPRRIARGILVALFIVAHVLLIIGATFLLFLFQAAREFMHADDPGGPPHYSINWKWPGVYVLVSIYLAWFYSIVAPIVRRRLDFISIAGCLCVAAVCIGVDAACGPVGGMELLAWYSPVLIIAVAAAWMNRRRTKNP
jgi:hypothetical protein